LAGDGVCELTYIDTQFPAAASLDAPTFLKNLYGPEPVTIFWSARHLDRRRKASRWARLSATKQPTSIPVPKGH
jgi:hypothetical protein